MDVDEKPPLGPVLEHYGAMDVPDTQWWRSMRCPFHGDHVKSASFNAELGLFVCFTCNVRGDVYDIVMSQEGVSFVEAKRLAEEFAGEGHSAVRTEHRPGRFLPTGTGSEPGNGPGRSPRRRHRPRPWT